MNFKVLMLGALAVPFLASPSVAGTSAAVWNGEAAQLLLVDEHEHHEQRRQPPRIEYINARQAAAIAKGKGFQVLNVQNRGEFFLVQARRNGQLFTVTISEEGRFLSAKPVRRGRDHDDY
ncbi:MAG: hypothetical protein JWN11_2844 [Hyphomicrobiales bacterium]|nr:hypothetical protein [Hyphomicrobiales bacterium]